MKITRISQDEVLLRDHVTINTNNHWQIIDGIETPPSDYDIVLANCETKNWIHFFHKDHIPTCEITITHWMKEASQIGAQTHKFSSLFSDELEDWIAHYDISQYPWMHRDSKQGTITFDKPYFLRSETVSLKNGQHGIGPYSSLNEVMESALSCIPQHSPLKSTTTMKLYFFPWIQIASEWRIFVKDSQITAISQQSLYTRLFYEWKDEELIRIGQRILEYFHANIQQNIQLTTNYSYDFAFLTHNNILTSTLDENNISNNNWNDCYFIEMNCFGKEYAAGSSLFDWIIDYDQLYGINSEIELRITI